MDFYFVSRYNPKGEKRECWGLFMLEQFKNEYYLKWVFGYENANQLCDNINREVDDNLYLIKESLLGETYTYGFPFKQHYFNYCISKGGPTRTFSRLLIR